jgi:hypothetical protein
VCVCVCVCVCVGGGGGVSAAFTHEAQLEDWPRTNGGFQEEGCNLTSCPAPVLQCIDEHSSAPLFSAAISTCSVGQNPSMLRNGLTNRLQEHLDAVTK